MAVAAMSARELFALGRPAAYAVVEDPMQFDVAPRDLRPVPDGAALGDLAPGQDFVCAIIGPDYPDGGYVPRALWHHAPAPGHVVLFHRPVLGGGGKGGSARLVLQIALMVMLPQLAPALKLAGILTGVPSALITAAGAIAGNALINTLVPLDNSNAAGSAGGSPTYSVNAQGNQPRIDQVIPELFGRSNTYADFAAPPYSLFVDQDQFLHLVLIVGTGQYRIWKVANESTPLEAYQDVQIIRAGPGQSTQAGPGTGVETLAEQTLVALNIWTSPVVTGQELEFGRFSGPYAASPPEREVTSIGVDVLLPRGLDDGRSVQWVVQAQLIDDFDQPLGAWTTIGSHTYSTSSPIPIRLSYDYAVAAGRYNVGFRRMDARSADSGSAHDITIAGLRGTLNEAGVDYPAGTYVCIKARATGQLNGALRVRVMTDRMLPVWDGSTWSAPQITRSPAWALARVLKARGLEDEQIDLEQLLALDAAWAARFDRFDFAFDTVSTMWDALALIARVGRAVPLIRGSRYTFWRDQQESVVVGSFSMRSIRRDSFRLVFAFPEDDPIEAIACEYFDGRRGDWVTVTAQWDAAAQAVQTWRSQAQRIALGLAAPETPARIKVPGIIGENHARRWAAFHLADLIFRPHRARFNTELSGLLPAYGSLCSLQHDVGNFGQGGDCVDWDEGTLTIETSEPLQWTSGAAHYIRLTRPTGVATGAILATPGADVNHVTLATAPGFTPLTSDPDRARTTYVFGPATNLEALVKPRVIKPRTELDIEIEAVLEDDRVHSADLPWAIADVLPDPNALPDLSGGHVLNLSSRAVGEEVHEFEGLIPAAAIELRNDGVLRTYARTYSGIGTLASETVADIATEWVQPQPLTTAITGLYAVRFTALGTVPPGLSGTFDAWLALDTSRSVEFRNGDNPSQAAAIRVEIRDIATETIQVTRTITLATTVIPGGGGE
jgi:hypothetical protein